MRRTILTLTAVALLASACVPPVKPPPIPPAPRVLKPIMTVSKGCVRKTVVPWLDVWAVDVSAKASYRYVDALGQVLYGGHVIDPARFGEEFAEVHGLAVPWYGEWLNQVDGKWYVVGPYVAAPLPGTQVCGKAV